MDKILEVKKLKISFRTNAGTVKAVRDISFDLERGKTLAIVGESGSGKSVTSKAILGILAGNSIIDGGEILYDGKDLLKIDEEEMHKIRGDKISMIFQDPLSSLNPIVKIGKQIIEAMLLKNKANRHVAKTEFKELLALLAQNTISASDASEHGAIHAKISEFRAACDALKTVKEDPNELPAGSMSSRMDAAFLREFIHLTTKGVRFSYEEALKAKRELMPALKEAVTYYSGELTKSEALKYAKELSQKVVASIDLMETIKDSTAYTFGLAMKTAIEKYFLAMERNPKEEARYAKQTAAREKKIAAGKKVDWKVIPKQILDLDDLKADIISIIERLATRYEAYIAGSASMDFIGRTTTVINYLTDKAAAMHFKLHKDMAREKAIKLMEEVGIHEPRKRFYQYPFEFSGGMRQRIVIAIALAANPDILICDEPTTALDVTIQAQILELINNLKRERNLSVIFITHDLGVVANMADDIAVMYAGKIVEYGTAEDIFYDPRHPYTWALLSSMPDLDTKEKLDAIPGTPPNMIYPPVGDAFADRNKYAMEIDFERQPPMFPISETHSAATWLLHPDAPKVDIPKNITDRIARMKSKHGGADNAK